MWAAKADADEIIRTQADRFSIIRFSKIISSPFKLFTFWPEAIKKGQEIFALKDMYFLPINMKFAVNVLARVARLPENIMINCSASNQLSYYETACFLAKHAGLNTRLIIPSSATDAVLTHNYLYVTLGTRELQGKLRLLPPSTINFLKDYLLDYAL
jgi:dTDP-4-dehydrorhamnose reductase